jgi:hypothetical protein
MSEYQYYEFLAIDNPLTEQQQRELRELSTRAQITATSFVNEYHWGDFRGNPQTMMAKYFDAFLYLANWGTRHVMIKLPESLLDLAVAKQYCPGEAVCAWAADGKVILSLYSDDEPDDYWDDPGTSLASIASARAELASGDTRLLYLAWLLSVQSGEVDDNRIEPGVPAGLRDLSAPLQAAVGFFRIDRDLLAAAAAVSEEIADDGWQQDLPAWVERLPEPDKSSLLIQVAQGQGARVQAVLLHRFREERDGSGSLQESGGRTAGELLEAAESLRDARLRAAAQRRAREEARRAQQAAAAYEKRLDELAPRQEQAWQQVDELIATKRPRDYDQALAILVDLRVLVERDDSTEAFAERFGRLRERHLRKPSLLERFDKAGLPVAHGS